MCGGQHDHASRRFRSGMAGGAPGAPRQGEGVHPAARRARARAPRAAVGEGREGLCVRRAGGEGDARRPVRRQGPAHRPALHVRPGLERRLPELLVLDRQLQRHRRASRPSRHGVRPGVARADRQARGLSQAHGLEPALGVVAPQRFQLRLRRVVRAGGEGEEVQFRHPGAVRPGSARPQRLPARRGRHDLPHLFDLCPRARRPERRLSPARHDVEGAGRGCAVVLDGLGPPARQVLYGSSSWIRSSIPAPCGWSTSSMRRSSACSPPGPIPTSSCNGCARRASGSIAASSTRARAASGACTATSRTARPSPSPASIARSSGPSAWSSPGDTMPTTASPASAATRPRSSSPSARSATRPS